MRSWLRIAIALLCMGAAVLIVVILSSGPHDSDSGKAVGVAVLVAFLSLSIAAAVNFVARQPGVAVVGYLTLLAAGVAFAATLNQILGHSLLSSGASAKTTWYSLLATFALGNTCGLLAGYDDLDPDSLKLSRLGTVVVLWALVISAIGEIHSHGEDIDPRAFGVMALLYVLGALTLPLQRALANSPD